MMTPVLTPRALNRALLARQLLLERSDLSAVDAVHHLVGLQAQAPLAPYVGLWSRLHDFAPAQLAEPLEGRAVVRATLMRGTVHLVTADDALRLRPLTEPAIVRGFAGGFSGRLTPEQTEAVLGLGRQLLDESAKTRAELREEFGRRWPDWDADAMSYAVSYLLPTVQPTPRGIWGARGRAELALMTTWLDRPLESAPSIDGVVLRYLGAFGPATVLDAQAWSGLTRLREVFDRLAPQLRVFEGEQGQQLYDLPDAPRPDAELPVPPRFLPEYDNVLFSHQDRSRITDPGRRIPLPPGVGARAGTFLVDGRFSGTWTLAGENLDVAPHAALPDADAEALRREGERLLEFLGVEGGAVTIGVHS
jgi:hypothetical protein